MQSSNNKEGKISKKCVMLEEKLIRKLAAKWEKICKILDEAVGIKQSLPERK